MTRPRVADDVRGACVYYCLTADGVLLYVGCAMDPRGRFYFHRNYSGKEWPHFTEYVVYGPDLPNLAAARDLERKEIRRLGPACNKHHNPTPAVWQIPSLTTRRPLWKSPTFIEVGDYLADRADLRAWFDSLPTERAS